VTKLLDFGQPSKERDPSFVKLRTNYIHGGAYRLTHNHRI